MSAEPAVAPRLGGEIPALTDHFAEAQRWPSNWLPFSNGRAALAWFVERHPVRTALVCAYTCPTVVALFRKRGVPIAFFDVGASASEIAAIGAGFPAPHMVVVPALFGATPWLDTCALARDLDVRDVVVIDAAQTAFGHVDFPVPPRGAVLSCPRKTTSLPDGAILAVAEEIDGRAATAALPLAELPLGLKAAARALWATKQPELEEEATRWHRLSEESWPDRPHRMSDQSRVLLAQLDRAWHRLIRRANRAALIAALRPDLPLWTEVGPAPFSLPVFAENRDEVVGRLRASRMFATALWDEAERDPHLHPAADWCARHVVNLSVDQRHDASDMARLADAVNALARPAPGMPEKLRPWVAAASDAKPRDRECTIDGSEDG
jgi:hypothetical protein